MGLPLITPAKKTKKNNGVKMGLPLITPAEKKNKNKTKTMESQWGHL